MKGRLVLREVKEERGSFENFAGGLCPTGLAGFGDEAGFFQFTQIPFE